MVSEANDMSQPLTVHVNSADYFHTIQLDNGQQSIYHYSLGSHLVHCYCQHTGDDTVVAHSKGATC